MMNLFYAPGACSMASHIALSETGLQYSTEAVDLKTHQFAGGDYKKINPKGYVPALKLDDSQILTESAVVLQYIADQKSEMQLMPRSGSFERYRAQEWLNFIATELHKNFGPLLHKDSSEEAKNKATETLQKRFAILAKALKENKYLLGDQYTVADMYLFVMLTWAQKIELDMIQWPQLAEFKTRVEQRPAVQKVLAAEAL